MDLPLWAQWSGKGPWQDDQRGLLPPALPLDSDRASPEQGSPVGSLLILMYLFLNFFFREEKGEREKEALMCCCISCAPPLGIWPLAQACALG